MAKHPLKLDHATLLHWTRMCMGYIPRAEAIATYEKLEEHEDYQRMRDNPELLKRLRAVLEADMVVRRKRQRKGFFFTNAGKAIPGFLKRKRFMMNRMQDDVELAIAERKKAHDAYEMLRKLSFDSDEGLMFKLEFT